MDSRSVSLSRDLVTRILSGERLALAKSISLIENAAPEAEEILSQIYNHTGNAHIVGITGPAGVGKSCLVNQLTHHFRKLQKTVGVVAVDPNSPFTGGAILGDRIRMQEHFGDPGVFIRSMGTRGNLGGLAKATKDVIKVLDASGKNVILVETAGAGQSEIEVINYVDTVLVVVMPRQGDEIQTLKAGILEIGDIFVVNKVDLDGADLMVSMLRDMLSMGKNVGWLPPVVKTIANSGLGLEELLDAITNHRKYLLESKMYSTKVRQRAEAEVLSLIADKFMRLARAQFDDEQIRHLLEKAVDRRLDPHTVARKIMDRLITTNRS